MSNIVITEENVSRFKKRLKKALEKEFGTEVPLNIAGKLLSQAFGVQDEHELTVSLKKESTHKPQNQLPDIEEIVGFIQQYFKNNSTTKMNSFTLVKDDGFTSLNLTAPSVQFPNTFEGFSLYFGDDINHLGYMDKEKKRVNLSKEDELFLDELVKKLRFDDRPMNIYLGERLKQYANFDKAKASSIFSFHEAEDIKEIANYGFVRKQFVIVDKEYFERVGTPFALNNDKYVFIDLKNQNAQLFDDFDKAFNSLDENNILMEFLKPIKQETGKQNGLSSYYLYTDNGKVKSSTVNNGQVRDIMEKDDYYRFLGQVHFSMGFNEYQLNAGLPTNAFKRSEIVEGFHSARSYKQNAVMKKSK